MKHIVTIVGARPQFIKAAVISRLIREKYYNEIFETLIHTGQHYDRNMSEVFFQEMMIPKPDINLKVGSATHGKMTGMMLEKIEDVLLSEKPDLVLVYGDTNSTIAGALSASKLHIPVAHVEAGLRSYNMRMPEEQNRVLTDHLSTLLFCPTERAERNLQREGIYDSILSTPTIDEKRVVITGDVMLDAALFYRGFIDTSEMDILKNLPQKFFLLTIHREENTDDLKTLKNIVNAINSLKTYNIVFPIHPRTRKKMSETGLSFHEHVFLLDPVGYLEMIALEEACQFIVTDSGGVQKEAFFFQKPCVTLRNTTEWGELVENGWNNLAGTEEDKIRTTIKEIKKPDKIENLYGSGDAGKKICEYLL